MMSAKMKVGFPHGVLRDADGQQSLQEMSSCPGRNMLYDRLKYNFSGSVVLIGMSEEIVLVTRKGQVTIPASKRKKYGIRQGMRVLVKESNEGILIKAITPIEDLAGVDASVISLDEMRKKLDDIRQHDRY